MDGHGWLPLEASSLLPLAMPPMVVSHPQLMGASLWEFLASAEFFRGNQFSNTIELSDRSLGLCMFWAFSEVSELTDHGRDHCIFGLSRMYSGLGEGASPEHIRALNSGSEILGKYAS